MSGRWYARVHAPGEPTRVLWVESDLHPDGALVDLQAGPEQRAATAGWRSAAVVADGSVTALELSADRGVRDLWFVEFRESATRPPAVNLMAFAGHGRRAGELLDRADLSNVAVRRADQLGALRWYPATGEVDQIYVAPAARRRGVGSGLVYAAAVLSIARGWPRMWADGQRTVLGEAFRNGSEFGDRAADLTHVAPPMTPGATA
ncbi:MAG TPA: GNAT family N-acetyltransferase [Jatrophihabitantaceae bacterium]|nr:GNAT family N-acetyltransferase [Jatrophihabitantaceae bacterium]